MRANRISALRSFSDARRRFGLARVRLEDGGGSQLQGVGSCPAEIPATQAYSRPPRQGKATAVPTQSAETNGPAMRCLGREEMATAPSRDFCSDRHTKDRVGERRFDSRSGRSPQKL